MYQHSFRKKNMSSNNATTTRVKSLDQLGELKSEILTQPSTQEEGTRDTFQPKGHRNRNDRPQQEIREFRHPHTPVPAQRPVQRPELRKPDPEKVLREINERVNPRNGDIPTLADFIMQLQDHQFSLEMRNPNQLKRFVKAQQAENFFYRIAYRGGDAYMTALQMYIQFAVDRCIAKRTPPKPQAQKVVQQRTQQSQTAEVELTTGTATGQGEQQVDQSEVSETV
jgi:hypothetical protein